MPKNHNIKTLAVPTTGQPKFLYFRQFYIYMPCSNPRDLNNATRRKAHFTQGGAHRALDLYMSLPTRETKLCFVSPVFKSTGFERCHAPQGAFHADRQGGISRAPSAGRKHFTSRKRYFTAGAKANALNVCTPVCRGWRGGDGGGRWRRRFRRTG